MSHNHGRPQTTGASPAAGASVDPHGTDPLTGDIEAVRSDEAFTSRAERLLKRDKKPLERLEQ